MPKGIVDVLVGERTIRLPTAAWGDLFASFDRSNVQTIIFIAILDRVVAIWSIV